MIKNNVELWMWSRVVNDGMLEVTNVIARSVNDEAI